MLTDFNLLGFIAVAAVLVASPGPDSILILRNTLAGGRNIGYMTVAGVQMGIIGHTLAAVLGLSALLYYSDTLFQLLAVAGALYLAWLGWRTISDASTLFVDEKTAFSVGGGRALRQGMLCNLLNPKVILLFIALMPNFVDMSSPLRYHQLIVLSLVLLGLNIPFQILLVVLARALQNYLRRPRTAQVVQLVFGGVLLFFATIMFAQHVLRIV